MRGKRLSGVSDGTAEVLYQSGYKSAAEVAAADPDDLAEVDGIGPERATGIIEAAGRQAAIELAEAAEAERLVATTRVGAGVADAIDGGEGGAE